MTQGDPVPALLRALRGETLERPPFWLMRQAGRYLPEYRAVREAAGGFLDLCLTPDRAAEVTLQPLRRFGMDAAILFSDILIVPYGLGQRLEFREGEGPCLEPVDSAATLAALDPGQLAKRVGPVYETVRRVRAGLPQGAALIGFAGAPWTVATYMVEGGTSRDFARVRLLGHREPKLLDELCGLIERATIEYLSGQIEAGAQVVQLFDSWAGVLPEAAFRRWVIAPTGRIVAALKAAHPNVPVIGFPRGAGLMHRAYLHETGVTALSLDTTVPLAAARELQREACVQGNLDPLLLVAGGAALETAVRETVATLRHGPFVFNLGHGIVPETPPENVALLAEILKAG